VPLPNSTGTSLTRARPRRRRGHSSCCCKLSPTSAAQVRLRHGLAHRQHRVGRTTTNRSRARSARLTPDQGPACSPTTRASGLPSVDPGDLGCWTWWPSRLPRKSVAALRFPEAPVNFERTSPSPAASLQARDPGLPVPRDLIRPLLDHLPPVRAGRGLVLVSVRCRGDRGLASGRKSRAATRDKYAQALRTRRNQGVFQLGPPACRPRSGPGRGI